MNSIPAPGRYPPHSVYFIQGCLAETVNRGKPLLGSPEKYRLFTAPAMGILVADLGRLNQGTCFPKRVQYTSVGFVVQLAGKLTGFLSETALSIDR